MAENWKNITHTALNSIFKNTTHLLFLCWIFKFYYLGRTIVCVWTRSCTTPTLLYECLCFVTSIHIVCVFPLYYSRRYVSYTLKKKKSQNIKLKDIDKNNKQNWFVMLRNKVPKLQKRHQQIIESLLLNVSIRQLKPHFITKF